MKLKFTIDKDRKKRYKEKIAHSRERLIDLEEWLERKEKIALLASEKAFQEAVEALTDIFAMLLSDIKLSVDDDYTNIEKIKDRGIISEEEAKICVEANGLRNIVTHRYNHFDEERFRESAKHLIIKLREILDKIENCIKNA